MRFSLILCTVGRTEEVKRFLRSLEAQTYRDFELIVVDQNPDDRLVPLLEPYKGRFPILHLRSERGLSRARNVGLRHISGNIVAFPDDDCQLAPDFLEQVTALLEAHPQYAIVSGRALDPITLQPSYSFMDETPHEIRVENFLRYHVSCTLVISRKVFEKIGWFDESLGAGSQWGSSEESDLVIRALQAGFRAYYYPAAIVYHMSWKRQVGRPAALQKAYSYGLGWGALFAKHIVFQRNIRLMAQCSWSLGRVVGGVIVHTIRGRWDRARYSWAVLCGRTRGFIEYIRCHRA